MIWVSPLCGPRGGGAGVSARHVTATPLTQASPHRHCEASAQNRSGRWGRLISLLSPHRTGRSLPCPLPIAPSIYNPPLIWPLLTSFLVQFPHPQAEPFLCPVPPPPQHPPTPPFPGKCQHPHPHCLVCSLPACSPSCLNTFLYVSCVFWYIPPTFIPAQPHLHLSSCTASRQGPPTPASPP